MPDSNASWSRGCLSMQGYGFLGDEEPAVAFIAGSSEDGD